LPFVVKWYPGGSVIAAERAQNVANHYGVQIRIDGICRLACTLLLNAQDVCITENAKLDINWTDLRRCAELPQPSEPKTVELPKPEPKPSGMTLLPLDYLTVDPKPVAARAMPQSMTERVTFSGAIVDDSLVTAAPDLHKPLEKKTVEVPTAAVQTPLVPKAVKTITIDVPKPSIDSLWKRAPTDLPKVVETPK
jgi:hypothetical protein